MGKGLPLYGLISCAIVGAGSGGLRSKAEAAVVVALPLGLALYAGYVTTGRQL